MTNPYNDSPTDNQNNNPFSGPEAGAHPQSNPQAAPMPAPNAGMPNQGQAFLANPADAGEPRQWIVAVLLAFFLGIWGAHNFYLGYKKRAIIQLVLTLVGFVTSLIIIGIFVVIGVAIWTFVEFIMLLAKSDYVDAWGRPLVRS